MRAGLRLIRPIDQPNPQKKTQLPLGGSNWAKLRYNKRASAMTMPHSLASENQTKERNINSCLTYDRGAIIKFISKCIFQGILKIASLSTSPD